jgi:hypothetical protein
MAAANRAPPTARRHSRAAIRAPPFARRHSRAANRAPHTVPPRGHHPVCSCMAREGQ